MTSRDAPAAPPAADVASSNLGLREALALAIVARRRREASESQWRARAEAAEAEAAALRGEAARRPPPPPPPLQLLAGLLATIQTQRGVGGATGLVAQQRQAQAQAQAADVLGEGGTGWAEAQVATLQLWAAAVSGGGALALEQQAQQASFLAALQRYLLAKDAATAAAQAAEEAGGAGGGAAPLTSHMLQRTPLAATLELLSDLLSAAGGQEQGTGQGEGGGGGGGGGSERLPAEQEAALLGAACSCLAALAALPGTAASDADYALLQQAVSWLLELAAEEPPQSAARAAAGGQQAAPRAGGGSSAGRGPAPAPAPAAGPGIGGGAAAAGAPAGRCAGGELARRALAALSGSAAVGMVVLGCAASAAQVTAARLLAVVTAENDAPGQGAGGGGGEAAAGEEEEAGLARALGVQAQLLTGCLAALPRWMQEQGCVDEEFMQGVTSALLAAVDSCQLLALSLPGVARAMNRVQVALVSTLREIAGPDG